MYTQKDAWNAYVQLRGVNHPLVKEYVRGVGGAGGAAGGRECRPEEERQEGYWPSPWVEMPAGGEPFDVTRAIATPVAGSSETVVLSYRIPFGFDGVILGVGNAYNGGGFVEAGGELTWRIRTGQFALAGRLVRNYSDIQVTYGGPGGPRDVFGGILVSSNDYITYTVEHDAASTLPSAGTRIFCNIAGFYWPRGAAPRRESNS